MAFRFVHSADIHLDSPLRSLALRDAELAELIGNATRRAFVNMVSLCIDERVDALLLAGDLYDGDQTSMKTARFLAEQMRRLQEAEVRVFVIRGNHDALSKITQELIFPDNVKVFGGRAEAVSIEDANIYCPVVIHGLSFAKPHAPESLLPKYKRPVEGAVNIGMLHTSLAGAPGHDPYAPCSLTDLRAAGYRYWALGHVHKRSAVEGDCSIVMPGMPQGRDINEAGAKSVSLVTIADDRSLRIEERDTSIARFERVVVDTTGIGDWPALVGKLSKAIEGARNAAASEHLVVRLYLQGATPLAWRIRRDCDLLKTEAEDRAGIIGCCWIEKLEIGCRAPTLANTAAAGDPVMELREIIASRVAESDAYRQEARNIADELLAQLPPECRDLLGADENALEEALAALAAEGADEVLARFHAKAPLAAA
ncbi:MAG TPA: DNA repair exonuclease [Gammaproteobacteria bacterium]|nr:DNA repair exonuclease [Gammaproteobacteria bacterium]